MLVIVFYLTYLIELLIFLNALIMYKVTLLCALGICDGHQYFIRPIVVVDGGRHFGGYFNHGQLYIVFSCMTSSNDIIVYYNFDGNFHNTNQQYCLFLDFVGNLCVLKQCSMLIEYQSFFKCMTFLLYVFNIFMSYAMWSSKGPKMALYERAK